MADFEEIYIEHFHNVYKYVFSLCRNEKTAEEITQEAFYKAMEHLDSFDGRCKLYVWLCQIAKNLYLSKLKEDKRYTVLDDNIALNEEKTDTELSVKILQKVHELDEPYKEVFMLRVLSELSFKKIASLFKKNESWARVTYYRARMKIKEELKDEI